MRNNLYRLSLATLIATLGLTGCTSAPAPGPDQSGTSPSVSPESADGNATKQIFAMQSEGLESNPSEQKTILTQVLDTGPSQIDIPVLPQGQTRVGFTIACPGNGTWKISNDAHPANAGRGNCSMDGVTSLTLLANHPEEPHSLTVDVGDGVKTWVTIYTTK